MLMEMTTIKPYTGVPLWAPLLLSGRLITEGRPQRDAHTVLS